MRKQETIIPVLVSKSNEAAKIGNEVYKTYHIITLFLDGVEVT